MTRKLQSGCRLDCGWYTKLRSLEIRLRRDTAKLCDDVAWAGRGDQFSPAHWQSGAPGYHLPVHEQKAAVLAVLSSPERIQDAANFSEPLRGRPSSFGDSRCRFLQLAWQYQAVHRKLALKTEVHLQPGIQSQERPGSIFNLSDTRPRVDSAPKSVFPNPELRHDTLTTGARPAT